MADADGDRVRSDQRDGRSSYRSKALGERVDYRRRAAQDWPAKAVDMSNDPTAAALSRLGYNFWHIRNVLGFWRNVGAGLEDDAWHASEYVDHLRDALDQAAMSERAIVHLANEQARWDARVCLRLLRLHVTDAVDQFRSEVFDDYDAAARVKDLRRAIRRVRHTCSRGLIRAAVAAELSLEDRLAAIGADEDGAFRVSTTVARAEAFIRGNPGCSHKEVSIAVGIEESSFRSHVWPKLKTRAFRPGENGHGCYPPND